MGLALGEEGLAGLAKGLEGEELEAGVAYPSVDKPLGDASLGGAQHGSRVQQPLQKAPGPLLAG